jgi:hypothetical protein
MGANSGKTFAAPGAIGGSSGTNAVSPAQGPVAAPLLPGTALTAATSAPAAPPAPAAAPASPTAGQALAPGQAPMPPTGQSPMNPWGNRGGPAGSSGMLANYRKALLGGQPGGAFFGR